MINEDGMEEYELYNMVVSLLNYFYSQNVPYAGKIFTTTRQHQDKPVAECAVDYFRSETEEIIIVKRMHG